MVFAGFREAWKPQQIPISATTSGPRADDHKSVLLKLLLMLPAALDLRNTRIALRG